MVAKQYAIRIRAAKAVKPFGVRNKVGACMSRRQSADTQSADVRIGIVKLYDGKRVRQAFGDISQRALPS